MPPSVNTQLKEFLTEVYENSASISQLSQELKSLINTLEPVLRLHHGNDHKESIETRIRLLEEHVKDLEHTDMRPECQLQIDRLVHQLQLFKQVDDNLGNEINKLLKWIERYDDIVVNMDKLKTELDVEKRRVAAKEEFDKEKRVNIKDVLMELLKWVLAITAAVIIAKATGQL
jgi:hypothetical protein